MGTDKQTNEIDFAVVGIAVGISVGIFLLARLLVAAYRVIGRKKWNEINRNTDAVPGTCGGGASSCMTTANVAFDEHSLIPCEREETFPS